MSILLGSLILLVLSMFASVLGSALKPKTRTSYPVSSITFDLRSAWRMTEAAASKRLPSGAVIHDVRSFSGIGYRVEYFNEPHPGQSREQFIEEAERIAQEYAAPGGPLARGWHDRPVPDGMFGFDPVRAGCDQDAMFQEIPQHHTRGGQLDVAIFGYSCLAGGHGRIGWHQAGYTSDGIRHQLTITADRALWPTGNEDVADLARTFTGLPRADG